MLKWSELTPSIKIEERKRKGAKHKIKMSYSNTEQLEVTSENTSPKIDPIYEVTPLMKTDN